MEKLRTVENVDDFLKTQTLPLDDMTLQLSYPLVREVVSYLTKNKDNIEQLIEDVLTQQGKLIEEINFGTEVMEDVFSIKEFLKDNLQDLEVELDVLLDTIQIDNDYLDWLLDTDYDFTDALGLLTGVIVLVKSDVEELTHLIESGTFKEIETFQELEQRHIFKLIQSLNQ